MPGFFDIYGHRALNQVFSDVTPIPLTDPLLNWLNVPDHLFLDYLLSRKALPFDGVPPNPDQFKKDPTFMICQAHRLWITAQTVHKYVPKNSLLVDLGAFPFSLDIILREYFDFGGRIHATANLLIPDDWRVELDQRAIELSYVNLDPYVLADTEFEKGLDTQLPFPENAADFVLFAHVVEHLYHPLWIFKEARRILKPGGRILVSTDNAFMLDTFWRIGWGAEYVHEPVEGTAAMTFNFWRGHNRFFTEGDLIKMLQAANFRIIEVAYYEVCSNSFSDEYFSQPITSMPKWRAEVLTHIPAYRNEVLVLAEKM